MSRTYSNTLAQLRITQTYIRLLDLPRTKQGTRAISLERIGSHEVLMFDVSREGACEAPLFWLELFDHMTRSSLDSCRCTDIAQAATVLGDFIAQAKHHG